MACISSPTKATIAAIKLASAHTQAQIVVKNKRQQGQLGNVALLSQAIPCARLPGSLKAECNCHQPLGIQATHCTVPFQLERPEEEG